MRVPTTKNEDPFCAESRVVTTTRWMELFMSTVCVSGSLLDDGV